ncbi:hypothetical protein [Geomonas propionica]|uniref:Lipoprotein n=1 Tax=Geomonas propionica TaxID=2798582 RepID=A0ABS0YM96_9BACT|nr:hypothetical protein [Geomonas propionica]MBJ6799026.1 hypothetical protein [Geomonas propionica]
MLIFRILGLLTLLILINGCAIVGVTYWPFSREISTSEEITHLSKRVCDAYPARGEISIKSKEELISSWGRPYRKEITGGIEKLTFERERFGSGIGLWLVLVKIPLVWLPINKNECIVDIENDKVVRFSHYRQASNKFYGCGVYYDWVVTGGWQYGCGNDGGLGTAVQ